jgi:hypothetical protein
MSFGDESITHVTKPGLFEILKSSASWVAKQKSRIEKERYTLMFMEMKESSRCQSWYEPSRSPRNSTRLDTCKA